MPNDELTLIAALADAEVLRSRLELTEQLLTSQQARADELENLLAGAEARLSSSDERTRELHVLLLHRDQEIERLHMRLEQGMRAPSLPAPGGEHSVPNAVVERSLQALAPAAHSASIALAAASRWLRDWTSQRRR